MGLPAALFQGSSSLGKECRELVHEVRPTGTRILLEAGLQLLFMPPEKDKISSAIRGAICVDPLPRNIHPVHNEGRRKARPDILGKIDFSSTALFVDAARYWKKDAYVVTVVNSKGSLVNAATVVTGFTHEAEELAIAVALQERRRDVTIFSDSRTAIRSFSSFVVSAAAASIVNKKTTEANEGEDPRIYGSRPTFVTSHPPQPATLTRGLTS
ncbi:hypothetical protein HPB52_021450 [Rhipicephalus sanguineus]|uniref:Uncharacterized protein n=1 Tax=Rhipicephalus sanguineus TaxID=34632 RepID=A0A9D4PV41_RHISA|nr:hypothetical protein HPB52_021450 [Rhipicephalus sanguineus]